MATRQKGKAQNIPMYRYNNETLYVESRMDIHFISLCPLHERLTNPEALVQYGDLDPADFLCRCFIRLDELCQVYQS